MILGGTTYPLPVPGTGGSLLESCDPFTHHVLPYLAAGLRYYVGPALVAAGAGTIRSAVEQTYAAPPEDYLRGKGPRFPLLCLYPTGSAGAGMLTLEREREAARYRLSYTLPVLLSEQAPRVLPVLPAAWRLAVAMLTALQDRNVPGSAGVLARAGVTRIDFGEADIGAYEGTGQRLPQLVGEMTVTFRGEGDPDAGDALVATLASIDLRTDEGAELPGFVEVETP